MQIKLFLSKIRNAIISRLDVFYDARKMYMNSSNSFKFTGSKSFIEREILVYCHTIEKGLSHKQIKPGFAKSTIKHLERLKTKYESFVDKDIFIWSLLINTLNNYAKVQNEIGNSGHFPIYDNSNLDSTIDPGAYEISAEDLFSNSKLSFSEMAESRYSVRLYDTISKPITKEEINQAVQVALNTPSACNRQAVKVHVVFDKNAIEHISDIQLGSRGFGKNSSVFLLITSDLNFYTSTERRLPMFDCGLFCMSLVYALFEKNIGTCILNGSFTKDQEKELFKIINIPENQMLSVIIALSKIDSDEIIKVAKSFKKDLNKVITFHE